MKCVIPDDLILRRHILADNVPSKAGAACIPSLRQPPLMSSLKIVFRSDDLVRISLIAMANLINPICKSLHLTKPDNQPTPISNEKDLGRSRVRGNMTVVPLEKGTDSTISTFCQCPMHTHNDSTDSFQPGQVVFRHNYGHGDKPDYFDFAGTAFRVSMGLQSGQLTGESRYEESMPCCPKLDQVYKRSPGRSSKMQRLRSVTAGTLESFRDGSPTDLTFDVRTDKYERYPIFLQLSECLLDTILVSGGGMAIQVGVPKSVSEIIKRSEVGQKAESGKRDKQLCEDYSVGKSSQRLIVA